MLDRGRNVSTSTACEVSKASSSCNSPGQSPGHNHTQQSQGRHNEREQTQQPYDSHNTANADPPFPHLFESEYTVAHGRRYTLDKNSEELEVDTASVYNAPMDISLKSVKSNPAVTGNEMPLTRLLMTVCVLSLALFIAAIDQTIVSTATVRISEEFKALSQAPWLANAYLLSSTALQPSTGKLSDIFGRTQMLLFGLVIFAIGSLVCALAHSMTVLLVGRAVAGIGAASIVGLTLVIVADIVPMRNRGPYMAIFSLVFSVSSVVGPLLGGLLTDRVTWRWIFWLSEPITGFVIVAVLLLLRLPRMGTDMWSKIKRIDYIGIVFLVGGLTSLILGMTFPSTSDFGWKSAKVIACLVLGGVVLIVFFIIEWKVAVDPVVPLRLFCIRNVSSMMAASFFMGACLFIPIYYIPIYYNVVVHTSATIAGIYMLPFVVGIMITSIGSGFLVMKFGRYRPFMWAGTAVCAVGLGLLALLKRDSGMAMRICSILVAGLGVGSFIQLSLIAGQAAVEPKDMASTTAVLTFFRSIGSIFGMAIMQTVMTTKLHDVIDSMLTRYPVYLHPLIRHTINNPSTIYYDYVDSDLRADVIDAYMQALHLVFLATIPFGVLMFLSTLVLEHKELARRLQPTAVSE